jgi:hypothetical protein
MSLIKLASGLALAAVLAGCAHPLIITPDMSKISRSADAQPLKKNHVAYYISETAHAQQVTTPGGGGDSVTSTPYRDLETGFYKMLTNVFESVTRLKTPSDQAAISSNAVTLIITPELVVTSSSSSMLTWPPTQFGIDLECKIADASGKQFDNVKVVGHGQAEFSEFKSDVSLSGKRAMQDALSQMQKKLLDHDFSRLPAQVSATAATTSIEHATPPAVAAAPAIEQPKPAVTQTAPAPAAPPVAQTRASINTTAHAPMEAAAVALVEPAAALPRPATAQAQPALGADQLYADTLKQVRARHSALDPASFYYKRDVVEWVNARQAEFVRAGLPPHLALRRAVDLMDHD